MTLKPSDVVIKPVGEAYWIRIIEGIEKEIKNIETSLLFANGNLLIAKSQLQAEEKITLDSNK